MSRKSIKQIAKEYNGRSRACRKCTYLKCCTPSISEVCYKSFIEGFIKGLGKINKDILCKMSEIKYDPNDIDLDRYFVYMNDGNGVYLTVNKFNKINKYNEILESVGKQNGTLYLDYGDYFQAK